MSELRDKLTRVWIALALPVVVLTAPLLWTWSRAKRMRYEALERDALDTAAQLDVGPARVRLWELYVPGGMASNDELSGQLLVVGEGSRRRVHRVAEVDYRLAGTLRERGHTVRIASAREHEGLLHPLAVLGVMVWVALAFLMSELS